jgi:hypothetical protein
MNMPTLLKITVEKPTKQQLESLKVFTWPIWSKEVSTFDWSYDEQEICYFLEGNVSVKTKNEEVSFGKGDLVTFPKGLDCVWDIKKAVKKHYKFG